MNWDYEITSMTGSTLVCCAVVGWVLMFIACCGVPSCCQYYHDPLCGVVRGREKNSVVTVSVCEVHVSSWVRNCVVMSHVFVCSEQDGCECDGFV